MPFKDLDRELLRLQYSCFTLEPVRKCITCIMPHSHLTSDESTEPVSCPYAPYHAASVPRQAVVVRFSNGFTSEPIHHGFYDFV